MLGLLTLQRDHSVMRSGVSLTFFLFQQSFAFVKSNSLIGNKKEAEELHSAEQGQHKDMQENKNPLRCNYVKAATAVKQFIGNMFSL